MNFPSINITESKKNKEWYKSFVNAIARRSLNSTYSLDYQSMDSCYKFYNSQQSNEVYKFLQEAEDGTQLPAIWATFNKIRPRINLLLGELMEKGYDFKVSAINKEAKSRKLEEKEKLRVDIRMKPVLEDIQENTGLDGAINESIPDSEEDLDEFFDKTYKEMSEIILYHSLKYIDKRMPWSSLREKIFSDILIAGKGFVKCEIINGIPKARRIDPRNMVFDKYSEDDFLMDSSYFGEVRMMNIADAAAKYQLTRKELEETSTTYKNFLQYGNKHSSTRQVDYSGFDSIAGSGLEWFSSENTGLRVMVFEVCWVDYKVVKFKKSIDSYGNDHFKRVSDEVKDKDNIVSRKIKIWRRATLVGGDKLVDYGEMPNQARDIDNLAEVYPPYMGVIPYFTNGISVSIVDQLKAMQNLKDIIIYNIQLAIARSGAKGFVYDVAQCPEGWEPETVIKYLKTVGIAFIDSKAGGIPAQFNQFQQIDLSLSQSVSQFLELSSMIDREMDQISGINDARQGVVQGSSQAVGVTRSALVQSSLTTAPYFKLFDEFSSNVFNQLARLVKISWAGKEKYASIIGDAGINFLEEDIELDLNDYAVSVEVTPQMLDDLNNFQQLVMAAIQSGQLSFGDAMELLMEKDVVSAVQRFNKISQKREKERMMQEQQMAMQMEKAKAENQMAMQQKMAEANQSTADIAAQKAAVLQQVKGQDAKELANIKLRGDIVKEQVKSQTK
jgi:D-ribose pyranose/furanose isomerase RbsD